MVTFFAASPDAFPWLVAMKGQPNGNTTAAQQSHVLSAYIWVSFPNGTIFTRFVPATLATVASGGYGSSGIWQGTGMKWAGTHDASKWVVSVDAEEMGIRGSLVVRSVCSPLSLLLFHNGLLSEYSTFRAYVWVYMVYGLLTMIYIDSTSPSPLFPPQTGNSTVPRTHPGSRLGECRS